MTGWYVKRDEQRYGPYTSTQMVEMARNGQVLPLDWVARGDGGQWFPASQVKGLFPVQATAAPPLPVAEAEERPVRRRRATHPNRMLIILACVGVGCLVVIVAVVVALSRGGTSTGKSGGRAASPVSGGRAAPSAVFRAGMTIDELIEKAGPPYWSWRSPITNAGESRPNVEKHAWNRGDGRYDFVTVSSGRVTNVTEMNESQYKASRRLIERR